MTGHDAWVNAATTAFSRDGVEAVRVEALARDLGVTKGSFYWHFADRPALLEAVLARWEAGAHASMERALTRAAPEQRVASFFRDLARPLSGVSEAEVFAWARRERSVAGRVSAIERLRVGFLKEQLAEMGASLSDGHRRAEAGYLAAVAWLERAARTPWMKSDYGAFVDDVFRFLLQQRAAEATPVP